MNAIQDDLINGSHPELVELGRVLNDKHVRIDLFQAMRFNLAGGSTAMVDAAQAYVPGETRGGNFKWVKHGRAWTSDDRTASLRMLLGIAEGDKPNPTVAEVREYLQLMNPAPGGDMPDTNPNSHQIELVLNALKALA